MGRSRVRPLVAGSIGLAGLLGLGCAAGAGAQLAALAGIAPGRWQLTEIGGTDSKTLCVADPASLLQIAHGDAECSRTVLDNDAQSVTVQYSCPGLGHGRTTLTTRSRQSFKLETQGLNRGAPFAVDYDAKRLGDCPARSDKR